MFLSFFLLRNFTFYIKFKFRALQRYLKHTHDFKFTTCSAWAVYQYGNVELLLTQRHKNYVCTHDAANRRPDTWQFPRYFEITVITRTASIGVSILSLPLLFTEFAIKDIKKYVKLKWPFAFVFHERWAFNFCCLFGEVIFSVLFSKKFAKNQAFRLKNCRARKREVSFDIC